MENIDFISNGRTGDLIHNLFVIKSLCENKKCKANLYITNDTKYGGDTFHFPIEKTYQDLKPLLESQDYINNFNILDADPKTYVNLNMWRRSLLFNRTNWINLLCDLYKIPPPSSNWVTCENKKNDIVLIHRSTRRHNPNFPWLDIIEKNNCKFITTDYLEYENFKYKNNVELFLCENFYQMVVEINSCKIFVGNMSTPLALAHSLSTPHLAELYKTDQVHYIGDENYIKNYFYIDHNGNNKTNGLQNFLKL
jgi:hypothetical protein